MPSLALFHFPCAMSIGLVKPTFLGFWSSGCDVWYMHLALGFVFLKPTGEEGTFLPWLCFVIHVTCTSAWFKSHQQVKLRFSLRIPGGKMAICRGSEPDWRAGEGALVEGSRAVCLPRNPRTPSCRVTMLMGAPLKTTKAVEGGWLRGKGAFQRGLTFYDEGLTFQLPRRTGLFLAPLYLLMMNQST